LFVPEAGKIGWGANGMLGIEGISAQALSDTIGAIYDCALDPERWRDTCRRMAELCESPAGGMCVHDMRNVQNDHLFEFGYEPEFFELLQQHYAQSPIAADGIVRDVGDVLTLGQICGDEELFESRFYRELLKPYGCLDFIGIIALRTGDRVAWVHASRTDSAPRYGSGDIGLFQLLSPHVCRALTISNALDIRTLRSEMLEATLDGLAAGVYLARRDGRVVYMNAAAERQVKAGNALRLVNNRLIPTDPQARATIAKAIDVVATDETEAGPGGHSLAIPDTNGAGYVATLLSLGQGRRQSILAPFAASVAIFAQDPEQVPLMPGEAFARLYRLTGGELRVLLALAQGLGAKEAAEMLGIGEPTVRTHLQRMFCKTGTSRQAELLHLLQSSAPPTL
jgi:DNA-binding CsgD family transcriptional regulator/PAS domain-containing protein